MPDFDSWLGQSSDKVDTWLGSAFSDAATVGKRIADRPTSIVVRRDGSLLDAQIVRIEVEDLPSERETNNAEVSSQTVIVLGYKNHATATDTDLQRGDRFYISDQGLTYEVIEILPGFTDRLLARARVTG